MYPYEWGILGVKAIALLLAIERTIPSPSSTSAGCFACKQDSGRAKALGIRHRCQTAPTGLCRAMLRCRGCISLLRMCHKKVKMKKLVKSSNKNEVNNMTPSDQQQLKAHLKDAPLQQKWLMF